MTVRQFLFLIPVFAAGLLIGAWSLSRPPAADSANGASGAVRAYEQAGDYERLERMIDALTEIVNFEVGERRRLEARIDQVMEQLAATGGDDTSTPAESRKLTANVAAGVPAAALRAPAPGQVTEQRFVEAGFPADVASRLKRQIDDIEMQRLYLRDQAVREGWLGSARYREEMRELSRRQNDIRTELSPQDYDRYLYALGRPNRVAVNSVLTGSPADEAGLQPGDQILSYDGTRIFSPAEVRRETSAGTRGDVVALEVLRDGQSQLIYVPRGPLGVQMGASITKP